MVPKTINIASLLPDTAYYYRIQYKTVADNQFTPGEEKLFHTQRARGSGYSFTVVADYHRDQNSDQEEIKVTFENIRKEQPDFSIDLGDTFMCEKFAGSYAATCARYIYDRNYFSIFGGSVPLYLVNGNHEGESGWLRDGTENNIAVWAAKARGQYYSCPANDGFYSGGTREETFIGKRTGYYSWEWGDALFVVLDPYWYTISNPKQGTESENWKWTLGLDQYMWLKKVLETSQSKYKFVFTHHVLGDVRGGIEWADLYEWGGHNRSGTWEFDKMRPGWDMPIHQLLVKNHVSILFQGHDHLYNIPGGAAAKRRSKYEWCDK
jgi:phosphodiesterase/alkaline phosphatase D-like protein